MCAREIRPSPFCQLTQIGRRRFLALGGMSAVALKCGVGNPEHFLLANEQIRTGAPRIRALFVGPSDKEFWMSWPGAAFDPGTFQAECSKTLASAASELDVQFEINPVPIYEPESIERELKYLAQSPPDGLLLVVMHIDSWPRVRSMAKECAELPKIVFSPLGTSLLGRHKTVEDLPCTFIAATPDHTWLATGLRMLKTVWSVRQTRICVISDVLQGDHIAGKLGSTLHYVPLTRWTDEYEQTEVTQEVKEIAKQYGIAAQDIVEPEMKDLLNSARNYFVARRIMEVENCQGISVDCAQLVGQRRVACGMCLAWSKLLDEGCLGGCEADADAAVSLLLSMQLLNRPGFMQDPAVNTINNTLVASHCTCARKLQGYDQPPLEFSLRSHYESNTGVAVQVFWPKEQEVTIFRYQRPDTMLIGTGRVLDNVQTMSAGGCRTAIEIELDGISDPRDVRSYHQVVVCGKFDRMLRAFSQIVDLKTASI